VAVWGTCAGDLVAEGQDDVGIAHLPARAALLQLLGHGEVGRADGRHVFEEVHEQELPGTVGVVTGGEGD